MFTPIVLFLPDRLRIRPVKDNDQREVKKTRAKKLAVAIRRPKSTAEPCKNVLLGQVIVFKLTGYCEWPACVKQIVGDSIHIEFFGDHTTQIAKVGKCFNFEDMAEMMLFNLRTRKTALYSKSIREAEVELGIPQEISLLNRIE